ncbi:MAG: hypothetical protein OXF54_11310 [Caldilineaceae bacterium]|nr:hypothetical protein [Caldilineaceae bacterium]
MPIVNRPNKDALIRALDIFLDKMRPFFIECLRYAPGATVRMALERSLNGDQSTNFARNHHVSPDLLSAVEVNYFATITETYWEEVFSSRFGGDRRIVRKLRKITVARNRASHPPHLRDLDAEFTLGSLCHIAYVLGSIRASEEQEAVSRLKEGIGAAAKTSVEADTATDVLREREARKADASVLAAEERARVAEAQIKEAQEQIEAAEISRLLMKERASAAEAARRSAEDLAHRSNSARQEADRRALSAEAGQLRAEKQSLATAEVLHETEKRLKETEATLRRLQKNKAPSAAGIVAEGGVVILNQDRRPSARNTPQYEDWLIREILSGKISRYKLCQFVGESRIDGRLVHYVQAAFSGMSPKAWKNYVSNRSKKLARVRSTGAFQRKVQPSYSQQGLIQ